MGQPDGIENAQWSIECDCPSVPSTILFLFINHQRFFFLNPTYFSASPKSKKTKCQVFTTRFVKFV